MLNRMRELLLNIKARNWVYLYPILMPILTRYTAKLNIQTFQDAFIYWLFTGFLQLILLLLFQKIIYSGVYNQLTRWAIALLSGILVLFVYMFLEFNYFHLVDRFYVLDKWVPIARSMFNIPIFIALWESVKSSEDRKKLLFDNVFLENENTKAQYNLLLQQINPHFLFNSLTVLQALVRKKDKRTEEFITKLGDIYSQTLQKDTGLVTLREEIEFFNSYIYLMSLRQENAIFVDVQIPEEALSLHLPAFALQLLAENSLKHNVVSENRPLYIKLFLKDAKNLTLMNNYQPKEEKSESFGIGIKNLKRRYALEGISHGVVIEQNEKHYSTTIKLL